MKHFIALAACLFALQSSAYPVFSGLYPDVGDTHLLVTIRDKACDPKSGNATINNTSTNLRGCWVQEGPVVKISIMDSSEIKVFPKSELKLMGDVQDVPSSKSQETQPANVALTCIADAWVGDVVVERGADGVLKNLYVSGDRVNATEQANAINFSFNGLNISLSTITGVFNYETSGFQSFLNMKLARPNAKGAGLCKINTAKKQF